MTKFTHNERKADFNIRRCVKRSSFHIGQVIARKARFAALSHQVHAEIAPMIQARELALSFDLATASKRGTIADYAVTVKTSKARSDFDTSEYRAKAKAEIAELRNGATV